MCLPSRMETRLKTAILSARERNEKNESESEIMENTVAQKLFYDRQHGKDLKETLFGKTGENESEQKSILDACCGSRMFWFNKENQDVVFMDNRELEENLCDGRSLVIKPDVVGDFRAMPFNDNSFYLVVFDPPHLINAGEKAWLVRKYGKLNKNTYKEDLKKGFEECFRVLKPHGTLVFKWNETDVKTSEILKLAPYPPLFGHKSGKMSKTQWIVFMKPGDCDA